MSADVPLLVTLVLLFLAAVFLAAAEAALLRVPRARIQVLADEGDRPAARVLHLIDDLPVVMNAVLLVVLLAQIGSATITGIVAERHFGSVGITVASIVLTVVLFVYAEAIPKTVAVRRPVVVARALSIPVAILAAVLRPLVRLLVYLADLQAPGRGIAAHVGVSEQELLILAAEAASAGAIDQSDMELIERSFELGDLSVGEVMVPRPDIVAVESTTSLEEAFRLALASGHRRIPVYEGDIDHITGVVRLRVLAAAMASERQGATAGELAAKVLVVPESKGVVELLREMQEASLHVAIAVDEHGGTAGIVTIEDVVAELVGVVSDEGEVRVDAIRRVADGVWVVDAAADVDDLEAEVGVELPSGEWRTVGGLVIHLLGHIPAAGESVEHPPLTFIVEAATKRRLTRVRVLRTAA